MLHDNDAGRRGGKVALLGLALVAVLMAPLFLSACSSREPEPTEPPVTIMRSEGDTATATPTATPEAGATAPAQAPAATQTPAGGYPIPTAAGTPRPTFTPVAYPTP
jgi:hypothetical protein